MDSIVYDIEDVDVPLVSGDPLTGGADWTVVPIIELIGTVSIIWLTCWIWARIFRGR